MVRPGSEDSGCQDVESYYPALEKKDEKNAEMIGLWRD